jgi:predicted transposase YbfD/YdcC
LRTILPLEYGIPSHDTFGRVFARIDPDMFQKSFFRWVWATSAITSGQVIPIDGKTRRHSYDPSTGNGAIHMMSAWASAQRLVIGQVKTAEKSNEITAIPELLRLLAINGCIVTIDALGCQKSIAAHIIDQEADYVLAVKRNQPHRSTDIQATFARLLAQETPADLQSYTTHDYQHGRDEIRTYWTTAQLAGIRDRDAWKGLKSIGMTRSDREVQGKSQQEIRYYIISRTNDVYTFGYAVRTHWSIENNLHWLLDVAFGEDDSRIHKDHAPQNMAVMRHMALNLLQQDQTHTGSIRTKRLCAGWNDAYLEVLLTAIENDMNQA